MATFVLIPGAGSTSWYWHRVKPLLAVAGHEVITPEIPSSDDRAGLAEYAAVVVEAIGDRSGVVLVAQSMGGFTAPLVTEHVKVDQIILVAAMTPAPGETPGDWWENTGQPAAQRAADLAAGRDPDAPFDPLVTFLHDVPPEVVAVSADHLTDQSGTPFEKPWPMTAWPDVPTRFLLCRDDRLFPAEFQRRVVRERLGLLPDEMPGGHLPALAHPEELTAYLLSCL